MWPMLSRYFCLPREVWDPGWNCISNLKHMSLNFSFLDVTFNHWAYRPHRYDVILVAKYNHHHHHDILRYHVMYPYVLLSSFWTSWDALGDLTLSSSGNLAFLRSRWSPALWSHAQHPPDGQQNSCCWVRVAWNCWNVHGVDGVHGVHDQIKFFAFSKSLRPRSESQWFVSQFHFKTPMFNEHRSCPSFAAQQQDHRLSCMPLPFIPLPGQAKLCFRGFRGIGRNLGDFKNFKEKIECWKC